MTNRNEINGNDKWDLSFLFANIEEYTKAINAIEIKTKEFKKYEKLELNFDLFKETLNKYYEIMEDLEKVSYYAMLQLETDVTNKDSNKIYSTCVNIATKVSNTTSFLMPKILKTDAKKIQAWINAPELKEKKIAIEKILREKNHILSEQEEEILANYTPLYSSYQSIFSALTNADMEFGEINGRPLTNSTYTLFLQNEDQKIRKEAFLKFYQKYKNNENTLANLIISDFKKNHFIAKTRKFKNTFSMQLFSNNIDKKVYTNLIETVNENLSALNDYYDFRKKVLNQEYLYHYDVYVPLTKGITFKNSFEEACEKILKSLEILGNEYTEILRNGLLKERWVDKYENTGKRSGAFSAGSYNGKPYILLNYKEESIRDMFTLAHEAGHSMHSYFSIKTIHFRTIIILFLKQK